MQAHIRGVLVSIGGVAALMIAILGFQLGGPAFLRVGVFSPLTGAFIGAGLVLVSVNIPFGRQEHAEPWQGREQMAWILIGCGCLAWGIGECFWRYYQAVGQNPFPSLADFGYSSYPPLVFCGLLLQPFSRGEANKRLFLILDSLIAMGALLSIAWFLLLGSLALTPAESALGKFLGLYYATADVALLSCTCFLLLRGQDPLYRTRARRVGLLVVAVGICIFAVSDFCFNIFNNLGLPVDGSWINLGWPIGMMTMGAGAYLRRFLPGGTVGIVGEVQENTLGMPRRFSLTQAVPYILMALLFLVVAINVLSGEGIQQAIRPVLVIATLLVIGLVIARQIVTIQENARLMRQEAASRTKLEQVYQDIAQHTEELEKGVAYLKEVQTRLANGDVRARARLQVGGLWPLAEGLNTMADRMMKAEQRQNMVMQGIKAVDDLGQALLTYRQQKSQKPFVLPASCLSAPPEVQQLLLALDLRPGAGRFPRK